MKRAILGAVILLVTGCSSLPAWQPIVIDGQAASLTVSDTGVFVGGRTDGRPFLIDVPDSGASTTIPLQANEPYAETADLVAITRLGTELHAIGTDTGGAHGNPRWTVWDGSPAGLTNHPQTFFTFGGHDGGPLLGVAEIDHEPMIIGTRTIVGGLRAALYTRHGTTWSQLPAETALSSDRTRVVSFTEFAQAGGDVVIVGVDLRLTADLVQYPSAWVGRPGHWQQLLLPVPSELTGTGLPRATDVACADQTCWVVGWAHRRPLAWRLQLAASATVAETVVLEGSSSAEADPTATLTVVGGHPVVATNADSLSLQLGCGTSWRALPAPGGVQTLAATTARLYALSNGQVWSTAAPQC